MELQETEDKNDKHIKKKTKMTNILNSQLEKKKET